MEKDIVIMSIESSCDETACAIVKNGREVLSNVIYSQIDIHKKFGGVVPEVASRNHLEKISEVIDESLEEANMEFKDVTAIATTYGPGLVGALLVGMSTAKALAFSLGKKLIPVNHIEGHIYANFIEHKELKPPFVCLIVSGGHSHLVYMDDYGKYEIMGKTRDDAVGEAFDKVARTLGLGYPGGPKIDKLAQIGNPSAIEFPRVYLEKNSLDFSFSGIKSSVLNYINSCKMKNIEIIKEDVAASFQQAVIEVLTTKLIRAAKIKNVSNVVLAGGVASNTGLRKYMEDESIKNNLSLYFPSLELCTDNAAMIGSVGYYEYISGLSSDMSLNAVPNLKLGEKRYVNPNKEL